MRELTTIKKSIVILLLLVLGFSALEPLTASAQTSGPQAQGVGSVFADSAGCVAGQALGTFLINLAIKGLNRLRGLLPDRVKAWFNLEDEVPIHNQKDWTKQHVLDLVARCGARAVLNEMTGKMIGAVRTSGRDCRAGFPCPSFVQNWRKFLAGGQYRGENIFRSMLASTNLLCPHYSRELKSIYKAQNQPSLGSGNITRFGNLDPYDSRARCTMPSGWTLANYQLNFIANGGWEALTRLAEPQNNFYGSLLMSQGELQTQRSQGQTEDIIEAITGAGMTSRRGDNPATRVNRQGFCSNATTTSCTTDATCTALPDDQGTGKVCIIPRDSCLIKGVNDQCLVYNDILTPGRVLGDSVSAVINNEMGWVTGVHEMEELMSNLTRLLMNRILNLSKPDVDRQEGFPGELYPGFNGDPDIDSNLLPNPALPPPPPPPPGGTCGDGFCDAAAGEDSTTCIADCPSPAIPQCSNAPIDDDNDGLVDFPADPGCSNSADNSELDTVNTTQCNDGFDNDFDVGLPRGGIDFPNDAGCLSATDNDEVEYVVSLCRDRNNGSPCEWFWADDPDLSDDTNNPPAGTPGVNVVGDNQASSFVAGGITFGRLVVEFCGDPNFGNCVPITIGSDNDFSDGIPVPNDWISSIRVRQQ